MTQWTLIFCEGAHDQAAITAVAHKLASWELFNPHKEALPEDLVKTWPKETKKSRSGAPIYIRPPDYLQREGRFMVVRQLGGIKDVLGSTAINTIALWAPPAVGVFADADAEGVDDRKTRFQQNFGKKFPQVRNLGAGTISTGTPRIGLWIAPNNEGKGRMDDVLMVAAREKQPRQAAASEEFFSKMETIEHRCEGNDRNKAILGALHQTLVPGAGLASGIMRSYGWIDASLASIAPFNALVRFLDELATPPRPALTAP